MDKETVPYTDVRNPFWCVADGAMITCQVKFKQYEEYMPFNCAGWDPEWYGRQMWAELIDGKWGAIAPYTPPTPAQIQHQVRAQRDRLLRDSDWTQLSDVPKALRQAWATYRQALRDVPQQKGFPDKIEWPAPLSNL